MYSKKIYKIFQKLASVKLAVVSLLLLFVLTAFGTLYQVDHGLYLAQKKFFYSFGLLLFGFLPFPGGQLVIWLLGINLFSAALLQKYAFRWKKIGILLIHYGLLLLLVGAFTSYFFSKESFLPLYENGFANVSQDYKHFEVALWEEKQEQEKQNLLVRKKVWSHHLNKKSVGEVMRFETYGVGVRLLSYFQNSVPLRAVDEKGVGIVESRLPLEVLKNINPNNDPTRSFPGIRAEIFLLDNPSSTHKIVLWGASRYAFDISFLRKKEKRFSKQEKLYIQLRRRRWQLPVTVQLIDFKKEEYEGTDIPKSYESLVKIFDTESKNAKDKKQVFSLEAGRKVKIFMNNPFRFNEYTFYQSSFSLDPTRGEQSVFAVVKNKSRWMPYVASLVMVMGLFIHFIIEFVSRIILAKNPKKNHKRAKR